MKTFKMCLGLILIGFGEAGRVLYYSTQEASIAPTLEQLKKELVKQNMVNQPQDKEETYH